MAPRDESQGLAHRQATRAPDPREPSAATREGACEAARQSTLADFAVVGCYVEFDDVMNFAQRSQDDEAHTTWALARAAANHLSEPGGMMMIVPIHQRFWWPHPWARPLLWRKFTIRYRYFINGEEISLRDLLADVVSHANG
jgi:hypothetical protein